jgi:hypothetical protein
MKQIQQKLIENKHKVKREKFLAALDTKFADFLSDAEVSSDASCMRYAAFPVRDKEARIKTSTRGAAVGDWKNFSFRTWQELISLLERFQKVKNYIGWFFIDADGPYYRISVNAFLAYIKSIANYGIMQKHYDFGWVGANDDVGIIITYNNSASAMKKFDICVWGI